MVVRGYVPAESVPTDLEIRTALQQLVSTSVPQVSNDFADSSSDPASNFSAVYDRCFDLLQPLDRVWLNRETHPEGDLLYHSLQVFHLAKEAREWDEDFLLAALLHDVGKGIDPYDAALATVTAIQDFVSERTLWLIQNLPLQHRASEGTIGARARRRIAEHEDSDELRLLAECDSEGRVPGRQVCSLEKAIGYLRELGAE